MRDWRFASQLTTRLAAATAASPMSPGRAITTPILGRASASSSRVASLRPLAGLTGLTNASPRLVPALA